VSLHKLLSTPTLHVLPLLAKTPPIRVWTDECGRFWFQYLVGARPSYGPFDDMGLLVLRLLVIVA
jgi:hypothetical protein